MIELDTNVVVCLLVGDDTAQVRAAQKLVRSKPCTVALSVLMECEWVLRGAYSLDVSMIADCFRNFLARENISAAEPALTQRVLDAYSSGVDFIDALHAAQCVEEVQFATFDKLFAKRCGLGLMRFQCSGSRNRIIWSTLSGLQSRHSAGILSQKCFKTPANSRVMQIYWYASP